MTRRSTTQTTTNGKLSTAQLREAINKKAGIEVSLDLLEQNYSELVEWIPTGSDVLDSIICRGKKAGIPVGRITELAGVEASGKSYFAAQIAANAQKMGMTVVYFDSESALDPAFLSKAGCNVGEIIYTQAMNIEFVLETIEQLLGEGEHFLFILDSFAFTPSLADLEGDFNPQSSIAVKPRIMSKGLAKLIQPIANKKSSFLVLNQLKQNIVMGPTAHVDLYSTPGGKALSYAYSLRIWLTPNKSKSSFVVSPAGFRIGSEVRCVLKKSRFGTEGRECSLKLLWGGEKFEVSDHEEWLNILSESDGIILPDGTTRRFELEEFSNKLQSEDFRKVALSALEEELIIKFDELIKPKKEVNRDINKEINNVSHDKFLNVSHDKFLIEFDIYKKLSLKRSLVSFIIGVPIAWFVLSSWMFPLGFLDVMDKKINLILVLCSLASPFFWLYTGGIVHSALLEKFIGKEPIKPYPGL